MTERGSGTVLMAIVMMMAGFLIMVTLLLGSAIVARHRAGAIADLSALAAASGLPGPEACDRARRVADANAGRLIRCSILGDGSVVVDVELNGGHGVGGLGVGGLPGTARGSARAGRDSGGPTVGTDSGGPTVEERQWRSDSEGGDSKGGKGADSRAATVVNRPPMSPFLKKRRFLTTAICREGSQ